jgi:hypothetical protein
MVETIKAASEWTWSRGQTILCLGILAFTCWAFLTHPVLR